MKPHSFFKCGIIVFIDTLFLVSCASSSRSTLDIITTPPAHLSNYNSILINISSMVDETSKEVIELESGIFAMLEKRGLFKGLVILGSTSPDVSSDLQLNVQIVKFMRPGYGLMYAPFARASVGITVEGEIIDLARGSVVGSFSAEGISDRAKANKVYTRYIYTSQAIKRIVEEIANFIQNNY